MWGPDGWKKVVVCVVSDGRNKINKRTLQVLTLVRPQSSLEASGCSVLRRTVRRWAVTKRASRRTRSWGRTSRPTFSSACRHPPPPSPFGSLTRPAVQVHLERYRHRPRRSLAERMSGADHLLFEGAEQEKAEQVRIVDRRRCHFGGCAQLRVSSHRWFFNAFGPLIQPNGKHDYSRAAVSPRSCMLSSLHPSRCRHEAHGHLHLRTVEM